MCSPLLPSLFAGTLARTAFATWTTSGNHKDGRAGHLGHLSVPGLLAERQETSILFKALCFHICVIAVYPMP